VVEVVVPIVPIVLGAFLGILASFPVVLDGSVAFLLLCCPFAIVFAFEQLSHHQRAEDSKGDSLLVPD
jgi:hypothetical protein